MKLKNLSINEIIKIINNMDYCKAKNSLSHAERPIEVSLIKKDDSNDWDFQMFEESNKVDDSWSINYIRIALYDSQNKAYSQEKFIKVYFENNCARLFYFELYGKHHHIKDFKRNCSNLKKVIMDKMNKEVINKQKRDSRNRVSKRKEEKQQLNQMVVSF